VAPIHLFAPIFRVEECLAEVRECLERGWTGIGFKTLQFEEAWREYTRLPHAHFLNSGTSGLHLAVKLFKESESWQAGDEIITSPITFVSTNHVILYEGLKPVFADVDETLCLDPASVAERINERTKAVCFVGIGGNIGRYSQVLELCRKHGLRMILDSAHMAGTWIGERHAGWDADVAVFSFHAVKNVPTADSGMICFAEPQLDIAVRKWSWMGISKDIYTRMTSSDTLRWKYDVEHVGFKYHGNSIMAALGLVGLKYLDQDNAYRRQVAEWYDEELKDCPQITRIPMSSGCLPSRHLYEVLLDHRDEVILGLNDRHIYPGVHYLENTCYKMFSYAQGTCPRASAASDRLLSLPMHLHLDRADVRRVAEALKEVASLCAGPPS